MGPYNPYNFGIPAYGYSQTPPVQPMQQEPPIKVPQVHGENGAKAYSLPPNSSILLMDETDSIIWAKMTDGAGYPTLKGFRIVPMDTNEMKEEEPVYVTTKEFDKLAAKVDKLVKDLGGEKDE